MVDFASPSADAIVFDGQALPAGVQDGGAALAVELVTGERIPSRSRRARASTPS
jgi:hypothetical protein